MNVLIVELIFLLFSLFILILLIIMLYTFVRGAPFVPTDKATIQLLLSYVKKGKNFADIGSGDGRVVLACAQAGAQAYGYEMNPILVAWSYLTIYLKGLRKTAVIHRKNFWNCDFSSYDVIFVYGIPYIMPRLEKKLRRELKKGAIVISNKFDFPEWKYTKHVSSVYVYTQS
jgi:ribosomal protein L11 methylase PrmA